MFGTIEFNNENNIKYHINYEGKCFIINCYSVDTDIFYFKIMYKSCNINSLNMDKYDFINNIQTYIVKVVSCNNDTFCFEALNFDTANKLFDYLIQYIF